MNPLRRALRPTSRRILASRLAPAVPARRLQSNGSGGAGAGAGAGAPFDPVVEGEMGVGELEGAKFKIEPLRRVGEDPETMRARLTYQSRKRGTLESDLLLSTFAAKSLPRMTPAQMREYDLFLDENDWDIYYWATQPEAAPSADTPPPTAAGALQNSEPYLQGESNGEGEGEGEGRRGGPVAPAKGEWAQTIGTFRPAYRPVPARWRDSEVLRLLREHVRERSAAGVLGNGADRERAEGMAFMPPLGERR